MIEIRINGRGGQGAVTTSEILAIAAFKDGRYSQAFPHFGVERRGAPAMAFCRIDDKEIKLRTHVYMPDYIIILDPSLLNLPDTLNGLKNSGIIILNSKEKYTELEKKYKIIYVDATQIALDIIGKPIVNTAVLGALSKKTSLVSLNALKDAIKEKFSGELADKNIEVLQKVYDSTN